MALTVRNRGQLVSRSIPLSRGGLTKAAIAALTFADSFSAATTMSRPVRASTANLLLDRWRFRNGSASIETAAHNHRANGTTRRYIVHMHVPLITTMHADKKFPAPNPCLRDAIHVSRRSCETTCPFAASLGRPANGGANGS
jgi:hypothetical protein